MSIPNARGCFAEYYLLGRDYCTTPHRKGVGIIRKCTGVNMHCDVSYVL